MSTLLHATERSPELIALDKSIKRNVLNGIEWLKKTYGEDWVEHIDMKTLDLRSGYACVLGQVHPVYHPDDEALTYDDGYCAATEMFLNGRDGNPYGFNANDKTVDNGTVSDWDVLQARWKEEIADLKRSRERKKKMQKAVK